MEDMDTEKITDTKTNFEDKRKEIKKEKKEEERSSMNLICTNKLGEKIVVHFSFSAYKNKNKNKNKRNNNVFMCL
jgi:hypothetical protein